MRNDDGIWTEAGRERAEIFSEWFKEQMPNAEPEPVEQPTGPRPDKHQASGANLSSRPQPEGTAYLNANHPRPGTPEAFAALLRDSFNGRRNEGGWHEV